MFSRLDKELRRSLVYVSAPAGSGKTTLVADYLASRSFPFIWYRLDRRDDEPSTFFHYLGMAVEKSAPGQGGDLPLLSPEYRAAAPMFARRYFEALFVRFPSSGLLVLDNYHELSPDSSLHEIIKNGLAVVPEGSGVVIMSRDHPPRELIRIRANKAMAVVGWDDIRFTDDEAGEVIRLQSGGELGPAEIRRISKAAGGWAAALVLLGGVGESVPGVAGLGGHEEIFSYFAEEVFAGLDGGLRDFLQRTAMVPEFTPGLAVRLTGRDDAGSVLTRLQAGNYFIERYSRYEPVYGYHPLFREFLSRMAHLAYSDVEIKGMRMAAARFLEEDGNMDDAAALYRQCGGFAALADLAGRQAEGLVAEARDRLLLQWLVSLPETLLAERPWLLYWSGVCRMVGGDPAGSRPFFVRAHEAFTHRDDLSGIFRAWAGVVGTYLHEMGDLRPLDKWISVLDGIMGRQSSSQDGVLAGVVAGMFGALAVRQPRHPQFSSWAARAEALIGHCPDSSFAMFAGFYLHTFAIWIGDYPRAESILSRMTGKEQAPAPLAVITARMAGTWVWLTGDCDASCRTVDSGLALAAETGVHTWDYLLLVQGVAASLSDGDLERAGEFLKRMAGVDERGRILDRFYFHYETSWYLHLKGDLPRAMDHQAQALKLADTVGLHYAMAQGNLAMAHLRHDSGDLSGAMSGLETAARIAGQLGSDSIRFVVLLMRAVFSFAAGDREEGMRCLGEGLAIGRRRGYVNFSWWHPELMANLCVMALDEGIEADYVRDLVRRRRLVPACLPVHLELWPWPVKIYTLGRFEIFVDGVRLGFRGKTPKKPLELLMVLIAMGGDDVNEATLFDILWPDADGDAAHKSLEVTITRLRKILGVRGAVVYRMGRVSLARDLCYIDFRAFELLLTSADAVGGGRALAKAFGLYRGDFLSQEAGGWAVPVRERLRDKFICHVGEFCRGLEEKKQFVAACDVYLRGLEADDLIEEFYQGLVRCYLARGQRDRALSVSRHCVRVLAAAGVEPSSLTAGIIAEATGRKKFRRPPGIR